MAEKLSSNKVGLTLGIFVAIWHAVWALLVGIGVAQDTLDWVLPLHFFGATFTILAFNLVNAVILIVAGFIGGYIMGWLFAVIWNCKCLRRK